MTLSQVAGLVGHWVQIRTTPYLPGIGGPTGNEFGILEAVDEGALLLKKWNGETLYLPIDSIREVIQMEESPADADTLLRASEAPEEPLLRPASGGDTDPDKLLTPG
jgi:hypothetical protein